VPTRPPLFTNRIAKRHHAVIKKRAQGIIMKFAIGKGLIAAAALYGLVQRTGPGSTRIEINWDIHQP
jgi:hypothetical protein